MVTHQEECAYAFNEFVDNVSDIKPISGTACVTLCQYETMYFTLAKVAEQLTHWATETETMGKSISVTRLTNKISSVEKNGFLQALQIISFYTF